MAIAAVLASVLAVVYRLSTLPALAALFRFVPPVVWAFFVPMLLTAAGVTPSQSPLYDWMSHYLLPLGLFLLTLSIDLPAIARLGGAATLMMLTSICGIMLGSIVSYLIMGTLLPADAWQGLTILSASWIGGSANALAWHQSLQASDSLLGSITIVDTVVGYSWLGIVIGLSAFQSRLNNWIGADDSIVVQIKAGLKERETKRKAIETSDFAIIMGLGLVVTLVCRTIGENLPHYGDPTIISATTYTVMLAAGAGMAASLTPIRRIEQSGSTEIGYAFFIFLMTSIGAKADFDALFDAPLYLLAALFLLGTHILLMLVVARFFRMPMMLFGTASVACVGGAISGPIAAAAFSPALAPVGVLLGVAGYVVGIYAPLLVAQVLGSLAGV